MLNQLYTFAMAGETCRLKPVILNTLTAATQAGGSGAELTATQIERARPLSPTSAQGHPQLLLQNEHYICVQFASYLGGGAYHPNGRIFLGNEMEHKDRAGLRKEAR
ncbi:Hypothetical predicted protein [Podarcis lilfordi]|uniref:Uncharacterized protein n=1 Tax=Podarcis lilfordi TaxID=74358 RepID=A0AA35P737_9SAUR|nr:Hypothetical predicted protein [Podarcis lilfordi]